MVTLVALMILPLNNTLFLLVYAFLEVYQEQSQVGTLSMDAVAIHCPIIMSAAIPIQINSLRLIIISASPSNPKVTLDFFFESPCCF